MASFCHRSLLLLLHVCLTLATYQSDKSILNEVKSSLAFVIDDTRSMGDDIDAVKLGVSAIFDTIINSNSSEIEDFVLVTFNDPETSVRTITKDEQVFKNELARVTPNNYNNVDCPEMALTGILQALDVSRPKSFLYVFTDAGAKDYALYPQVSALAAEKESKIIFVLTGICGTVLDPDYSVFEKLANDTGGEIFNIKKDDIGKILDYVKDSMDSRRKDLFKKTVPPGRNRVTIPVGDVKDIIVSVTGDKPFVDIMGPDGLTPPYEVIVNTSNAIIIKVKDPVPGNYTITTDSKSKVTITATGKVEDKPAELARVTTIKVRQGVPIKLGGKLSKGHPTPLLTWEFRPEGASDFVLLPDRGEEYGINFTTPAHAGMYRFAAENSLGRDEQFINLVVEVPPKIDNFGEPVDNAIVGDPDARLPCIASGSPKPTIAWYVNGEKIIPDDKYSIRDDGTLIIREPGEDDTNSYTCEISNEHGSANNTVDLTVSKTLTNDDYGDVNLVYIKRGDSTFLICPREPTDTFRWFKDGNFYNVLPSQMFSDATEEYDGVYTCRVNTENGTVSHSFLMDVGYAPRPRQRGVQNVEWTSGADVIDCNIDMKPPAKNYKWLHKGKELNGKNYMNLRIVDWGEYTCQAENVHGSAETKFHVFSKDCMVKQNKPSAPRVLGFGPSITQDPTGEYIIVRSGAGVRFACSNQNGQQNSFVNFRGKSVINAVCDKEDQYTVNKKPVTMDDLQCLK